MAASGTRTTPFEKRTDTAESAAASEATRALRRRTFLQISAAAVSVVALPIAGCGSDGPGAGDGAGAGGVAGSGATSGDGGTQNSIVWELIPDLVFAAGVASSVSIAEYLSHPDEVALTITKNEVPLPPGVTFDPVALRFDYDGVGAAATSTGHVVSADVVD